MEKKSKVLERNDPDPSFVSSSKSITLNCTPKPTQRLSPKSMGIILSHPSQSYLAMPLSHCPNNADAMIHAHTDAEYQSPPNIASLGSTQDLDTLNNLMPSHTCRNLRAHPQFPSNPCFFRNKCSGRKSFVAMYQCALPLWLQLTLSLKYSNFFCTN